MSRILFLSGPSFDITALIDRLASALKGPASLSGDGRVILGIGPDYFELSGTGLRLGLRDGLPTLIAGTVSGIDWMRDGTRIAEIRDLSLRGTQLLTATHVERAGTDPARLETLLLRLDWQIAATVDSPFRLVRSFGTDGVLLQTSGDTSLSLRSAADRIEAGNGHDRLFGGGGSDQLDGGAGNDSLFGGTGADTVLGGLGHDRLDGGGGNDSLDGGNGADLLTGGNGNDLLDGGPGNDSLDGGAGVDLLYGGDGNDILRGGSGANRVWGGSGDDTLIGGNDRTEGSFFGGILYGGPGNDRLAGGFHIHDSGATLYGGIGDDTITAGVNMTAYGGHGNDLISVAPGANAPFARFSGHGDTGHDSLSGSHEVDYLYGGTGNDTLDGNGGRDHLWGGSGSDTYVLDTLDDFFIYIPGLFNQIERKIYDFEPGLDRIDLSGLGLRYADPNSQTGTPGEVFISNGLLLINASFDGLSGYYGIGLSYLNGQPVTEPGADSFIL